MLLIIIPVITTKQLSYYKCIKTKILYFHRCRRVLLIARTIKTTGKNNYMHKFAKREEKTHAFLESQNFA